MTMRGWPVLLCDKLSCPGLHVLTPGGKKRPGVPVHPSPQEGLAMAGWQSKPGVPSEALTIYLNLPSTNTQALFRSFRPGREAGSLTWTLCISFFST